MGKTRGLVVKMECNDNLVSHNERGVKCLRTEDPNPPHHKDLPIPSSPNDGCRSPTTPVAAPHPPNADTPLDVDQEMEEQTVINTSKPSWVDSVDDALPPQASKNGEPHTQAECLVTLHKSLESAMDALNKLSIHTVLPERTISLVQELYHRTKMTSSDEQGPSDDILAVIRKLAKDVEDLKRTAPNPLPPPPPTQNPTRPKNVFTTGPTICPTPKTPKPAQPPLLNNPWQRHHPACLILQIPPTVDPNDRLMGIKAVEATNIALAPHTKATIIAVKWNDKGNCIAISHPDFTATDLVPFGNTIAAAITGQNVIECTATPDKKWHCIILNRVDTGKTDIDEDIELTQFQGHRPEEILKELQTNNPSLATMTIMEARWLTHPENLHEKTHSSVILTVSLQENVDILLCHVWRVVMYGRLASFAHYQDMKPVKQCTVCWSYGHLKCNKDPKYRSCAGKHTETDHTCLECPTSEDNHKNCNHLPTKCANCKGPHPADDTKCPSRMAATGTTRTPPKGGRFLHSNPTSNTNHDTHSATSL